MRGAQIPAKEKEAEEEEGGAGGDIKGDACPEVKHTLWVGGV